MRATPPRATEITLTDAFVYTGRPFMLRQGAPAG
jgi:hypothetical protein